MVRCGILLMSKALFGGTLLLHSLTTLSGVTALPPVSSKVTPNYLSHLSAQLKPPLSIGNICHILGLILDLLEGHASQSTHKHIRVLVVKSKNYLYKLWNIPWSLLQ